jgi:hypothetical protein
MAGRVARSGLVNLFSVNESAMAMKVHGRFMTPVDHFTGQ